MADYIALDVETTGLSPYKDRIIEIGALKVSGGEVVARFQSLVRYEFPLPERITEITGITDEELCDAPSEKTVMADFFDFFGDTEVILGHNIPFDYGFIRGAAARTGYSFEPQVIDTLAICKKLYPDRESRKLADMCSFFEIDSDGWHRAFADAYATYRLFEALSEKHLGEAPELFVPARCSFREKKTEPITPRQKKYLLDLLNYHKINTTVDVDMLSKSEASRLIDKIIFNHGR